MPSIKVINQATAANALNGLKFAKLARNALVSLYASGVTAGDTIGMSFGDREVLAIANGQPNIEISADVCDTGRDQILFAEPAEAGDELFLPVTVTTAMNFLVVIDEL